MKFEGFVGGKFTPQSKPIGDMRRINWYPEVYKNGDAKSIMSMQPTEGYKIILDFAELDHTLPAGSFCRGSYRTSKGIGAVPEDLGSRIYVVGSKVYWLKNDNSIQTVGNVANLSSYVYMVDDGFGLIISDGVSLYRLDLETIAFNTIPFTLIEPAKVEYYSGYTLAIGKKSGLPQNTIFYTTEPYQNNDWGALDYFSAEQSQDPAIAMINAGSYLYVFGVNSWEAFSPTGNADLPFKRAFASSGNVGIVAPASLCKIGNQIFFLGSTNQGSPSIYTNSGSDMVRISDVDLDQKLSTNNVTDCTAWTYSNRGHDFVVFNFDEMNETYVFDLQSGLWHQRASRDEITDVLNRWNPNYCLQFGGQTIVGDRYSSKIYELSNNYKLENGKPIIRINTGAHFHGEQLPFKITEVRIDMEQGNGITDEDEARYTQSPTVMLRMSQDQGRTWGAETRVGLGATGQYLRQVNKRGLGVFRNFTLELKLSDPCQTSIINAFIDVEPAVRVRK